MYGRVERRGDGGEEVGRLGGGVKRREEGWNGGGKMDGGKGRSG